MRCNCNRYLTQVDLGEYICKSCGKKFYSLRIKKI